MRSFLLLLLIPAISANGWAKTFEKRQVSEIRQVPATANRSYRLLIPDGAEKGDKLPLVIYLHGAGAKGSENEKAIEEPFARHLSSENFQKAHPCYVLVPQCREGEDSEYRPNNWVKWKDQKINPPAQWERSETEPSDQLQAAMAALDEVVATHAVDTRRIYLAGVSMGASGSWNWVARDPDRFAAIITACGLSETTNAAKLSDIPSWAFHGSEDDVAPVGRTREMVKALRTAGGANVKFTEYGGLGHNITKQILAEPGLFEWLYSFSRNHPRVVATPKERAPIAGHAALKGDEGTTLAVVSAEDADFFEKKIRPVLAENCFKCHGDEKQRGGLRVDSRSAMLAGGDIGPAFVAGMPGESLLVKAVRYEDEDIEMPPKKQLPAAQIADLVEWIQRGAPWPGAETDPVLAKTKGGFSAEMKAHWAFQSVGDPQPPASGQGNNPVDAFLDEKISAAGLQPTAPADAATLLRRLTLDLIGLPPSVTEVDTFKNEHARAPKAAIERAIERLLASPHHGEKFGRHWLDVARYADSNGSEVDHAMSNAWRYRDYVIRSFNDDKPFDRFIQEQVAGDLIKAEEGQPPIDPLIGTGFLMLGPKALAELDKPKLVADIVDEQVDTLSRAFMGMTVGCARCHDHKFDPISEDDYYSMAGIFTSTRSMDVSKRVATWTERALSPEQQKRVDSLTDRVAELRVMRDAGGDTPKKKLIMAPDKNFLLIEAEDFTRGNVRVETDSLGKGIGVIRTLMEYPDHVEYEVELPEKTNYRLELRYVAMEARATELSINGNLVDMSATGEVTPDWQPADQRWFVQGIYPFKKGRNVIAFHRDGPIPVFDKILLGKPIGDPFGPGTPVEPIKAPVEGQTKKQLDAAITATQRELETIPTTLAPFDGPVADTPILIRGNPGLKGDIVPRGFLSVVTGLEADQPGPSQSGRAELAEWIIDPKHPLTARVIVNRAWQWHFGQGLVRSPDNFGLRGEIPSHPELLDFLATWFIENGWSMKKLHALICSSEAYQRAILDGPAPKADPENLLLSHFPRRKLSAEELRDSMLLISGQLDTAAGGIIAVGHRH